MIRALATLCLLAGLSAVLAAGWRLAEVLRAPLPGPVAAGTPAPLAPPAARADAPPGAGPATPLRRFRPIFGEPAAPPAPAPSAPAASAPPAFDYRLAGTVVTSAGSWAVLSGPAGDLVVREGDMVGGSGAARIARIGVGSVEVAIGADRLSLGFADGTGGAAASAAVSDTPAGARSTAPYVAMVQSLTMSREDVLALVAEAEARRGAATR